MIKKYLDYSGLKQFAAKLLFGRKKIWHGTREQWDALAGEEKNQYNQAEIIDDPDNSGLVQVVDKIEKGNMNPVTSNAVAEYKEKAGIGDFVDVSASATQHYTGTAYRLCTYADDGVYLIVGFRRISEHLVLLDMHFTIEYKAAVSAGVERDEQYVKFEVPFEIAHYDDNYCYVNTTGYIRSDYGITNPVLRWYKSTDGHKATITLSSKTLHTKDVPANTKVEFYINGLVAVEKWLSE